MVAAICGPRDKRINSAVRIAYVRSLRTIYYSTMNAALHFRSFDTKIIWLFRRHRLEEFFCARRVSSTNQIPKYSRGISSVFNASSWQKYRAVLADTENARGKEKCRANGVDGVSRRLKASGTHCPYRSIIESVLHHRTDRYLHTGILKSNER